MKTIGIIPARYASKRFPGKVIADLCGKPVVQWVWEQASSARCLREVMVCTDDLRVKRVVESFGGTVLMTPAELQSGTERIAYAVKRYSLRADIVVNIQSDEPFITPGDITLLDSLLRREKKAVVATLMTPVSLARLSCPNVVKVVTDQKGYALYFSRLPIPYIRDTIEKFPVTYFQHIGVYAYTMPFLRAFKKMRPSILERAEKLEQLRFLDNGYAIKVGRVASAPLGIDTPEDLEHAKMMFLKKKGVKSNS